MLQPHVMKLYLPVTLSNGMTSTTTKVWEILVASQAGDLPTVKQLGEECPDLLYVQYNYTPPVYFAVREGHTELVKFLLGKEAHDPN